MARFDYLPYYVYLYVLMLNSKKNIFFIRTNPLRVRFTSSPLMKLPYIRVDDFLDVNITDKLQFSKEMFVRFLYAAKRNENEQNIHYGNCMELCKGRSNDVCRETKTTPEARVDADKGYTFPYSHV